MILISKKHVFKVTLLILSLLIVSIIRYQQQDNKQINFVKQVIHSNKLNSVFYNNEDITDFYIKSVLSGAKPSEYFGNSFEGFEKDFQIIGNGNRFFNGKVNKYEIKNQSEKYMDILVVSESAKKTARFTFQKKNDNWLLYQITFEN